MLETIFEFDRGITFFINGAHTPFWDAIMLFFSSKTVWIPLYLAMAAAMFFPKWYGKPQIKGWLAALIGIVAILLAFGLTDQICNLLKNTTERLRPGHDPITGPLMWLPDGKGGLYTFPSAHSANSMCLAVLTSLIFRRKWYTITLVSWSIIIGFSRIYLARHFFTDVLCGLILGAIIAYLIYKLWEKVWNIYLKKHNQQCSVS